MATPSFTMTEAGIVDIAVRLRVPMSGDPDIDAMIRQSRRMDYAGQAMQADLEYQGLEGREDLGHVAGMALEAADALLAASGSTPAQKPTWDQAQQIAIRDASNNALKEEIAGLNQYIKKLTAQDDGKVEHLRKRMQTATEMGGPFLAATMKDIAADAISALASAKAKVTP